MFLLWAGFIVLILSMLAIDLGIFHRRSHAISIKESFIWTGVWIFVALIFNIGVYYMYENGWGVRYVDSFSGSDASIKFFTGYVIEKSLSLDNIFVIALIFSYFSVPLMYQHRVLYWGILGAIIMRGIFIGLGAILIQSFSWILYIFAVLLILTAIKMLMCSDDMDPGKNFLLRLAKKFYPVSPGFEGQKFFTRVNGIRAITPLFLVLLVVESSDVIFAVDSIPAIFAITTDPFIIFTSNIFAILGLRSLYFVLSSVMNVFKYIKTSLVFILVFIGVKMIASHYCEIPAVFSLSVILGMLLVGILASVYENVVEKRKGAVI